MFADPYNNKNVLPCSQRNVETLKFLWTQWDAHTAHRSYRYGQQR
jgi:hypothetical protein